MKKDRRPPLNQQPLFTSLQPLSTSLQPPPPADPAYPWAVIQPTGHRRDDHGELVGKAHYWGLLSSSQGGKPVGRFSGVLGSEGMLMSRAGVGRHCRWRWIAWWAGCSPSQGAGSRGGVLCCRRDTLGSHP